MGPSGPVALSLPAIITGIKILNIDSQDHEAAVVSMKNFYSLVVKER